MTEYIEREAAYKAIMGEPPDAHYPQWYADKIMSIPSADVAPVRHGRWDSSGKYRFQIDNSVAVRCTECDVLLPSQNTEDAYGIIAPSAAQRWILRMCDDGER